MTRPVSEGDRAPGQEADRPAEEGRRKPVHVRGEKVVLREKRLEDAPDDYAWRSDPELATYDAVAPLRLSLSDFMIIFREELRYPSSRQMTLSIDDFEGRHIGNCMFYDINERRGSAELGIMIGDKDYWSQGFGADVVRTLLRHIFASTPLTRVYLHTLSWNVRAQRSFKKAGFVPTSEVQRNGQTFIAMEVHKDQFLQGDAAHRGGQAEADVPSRLAGEG